jgi:hypothetical protein
MLGADRGGLLTWIHNLFQYKVSSSIDGQKTQIQMLLKIINLVAEAATFINLAELPHHQFTINAMQPIALVISSLNQVLYR